MENAGYLFAAFTIIWALVFGYVLVLFNRQRRMRREIDSLKEAFKEEHEEQ
jgi:CcmD family protein